MSRNKLAIISIAIASVLGLLSFLITKTVRLLRQKEMHTEELKTFPDLLVQNTAIRQQEDWRELSKTTIIIFFNSNCEHCQYEARAIAQNISAFTKAHLLFISEESKKSIIAFSTIHKLDSSDGVWWLKMQSDDVYKTFGPISVPHIWIYNKQGQLVKEFSGETKVEAILEWL